MTLKPICGHTDPAALELIESDARAFWDARRVTLGAPWLTWDLLPEEVRERWRLFAATPLDPTWRPRPPGSRDT